LQFYFCREEQNYLACKLWKTFLSLKVFTYKLSERAENNWSVWADFYLDKLLVWIICSTFSFLRICEKFNQVSSYYIINGCKSNFWRLRPSYIN
jgi:hypothetical protein